jgi:hypothetical protein
MRTTLTLDDDVAAQLKAQSRHTGRPFREIVNETLRRGLASPRGTAGRQPFKIAPRDLGDLKPGLSLDNVAELIEQRGRRTAPRRLFESWRRFRN